MSNKSPLFYAMGVDPLIYERFIDEMAARGFCLEEAAEKVTVSALVEALYGAAGIEATVASVPSLEMKQLTILDLQLRLRYAESGWPLEDAPVMYGEAWEDARGSAIYRLFRCEDSVAVEAEVCEAYGIQPGRLIPMLALVRQTADDVIGVHEGAIVHPATMSRMGAKQAVAAVVRMFRDVCEERGVAIVFWRRFVEDALSLLGVMAILRKQSEVCSVIASPDVAIREGRYVAEVRYADEISDAYLECASEGKIDSCMAKPYGWAADGLLLQYGSLYGVHAVVVVYKDLTDVAGTRKPVARFLVERAICVSCGTVHTVIATRYTSGATFSMPVAEFVARAIAKRIENSVLIGEDKAFCKVCSSPLMTVLDVGLGITKPIWSDWASHSILMQDSAGVIEIRLSGVSAMPASVVRHTTKQDLTGSHLDGYVVELQDTRQPKEVMRLYQLARQLASIEEPPISTDKLATIIGDAIRLAACD